MQMPLMPRSRSIGSTSERIAPVSAAARTSVVIAVSMRWWLSRNSSESAPTMAFRAVAIPRLRATYTANERIQIDSAVTGSCSARSSSTPSHRISTSRR